MFRCVIAVLVMSLLSTSMANNDKKFAKILNDFNFVLMSKISSNENSVISPFSVTVALSMLYSGMKGNTKHQVASLLHLDEANDDQTHAMVKSFTDKIHDMQSANKVWISKEVNVIQSFINTLQTNYDATIGALDTSNPEEARKNINQWVSMKTEGNIKDLFPEGSIDSLTRLVIANALFYKGQWSHKFDKKSTRKGDFHLDNGETIQVDLMYNNEKYPYLKDINTGVDVVELPYGDKQFSMVVVVPNQNKKLSTVEQTINSDVFSRWVNDLKASNSVDVILPKFTVEKQYDLKEKLLELGISDLFTAGVSDLSGVNDLHDLVVSGGYHKVRVEVDEEGTTAAAATGLGIIAFSMPPQIRVDRPFLFYIIHKESNAIIFNGKITNPSIS